MRSMTGYGRGDADHAGTKFSVELNSVNRKQSDIVINLPRDLAALEPRIRQAINEKISRGRMNVLVGLHQGANGAAAHNFTKLHVSGNRRQLAAFYTDSVRWTFWPSLAMTAFVLLLGKPILYLFGAVFTQGYSLLFILSIGLLARAAVGPADRLLNMLGEQKVCALVYVCVFALNFIGCLLLIPHFGVTGAAISTSMALVVESITLFLIVSRRLGMHPLAKSPGVGRSEATAL